MCADMRKPRTFSSFRQSDRISREFVPARRAGQPDMSLRPFFAALSSLRIRRGRGRQRLAAAGPLAHRSAAMAAHSSTARLGRDPWPQSMPRTNSVRRFPEMPKCSDGRPLDITTAVAARMMRVQHAPVFAASISRSGRNGVFWRMDCRDFLTRPPGTGPIRLRRMPALPAMSWGPAAGADERPIPRDVRDCHFDCCQLSGSVMVSPPVPALRASGPRTKKGAGETARSRICVLRAAAQNFMVMPRSAEDWPFFWPAPAAKVAPPPRACEKPMPMPELAPASL